MTILDRARSVIAPVLQDMPEPAPLTMPVRGLNEVFRDPEAGTLGAQPWLLRLFVFGSAIAVSVALAAVCYDWFDENGIRIAEMVMVGLVAFSAFGIALSVFTSLAALLPERRRKHDILTPIRVALLVPVYEEDPVAVFARIRAMRADLASHGSVHEWSFFVLSDTRNEGVAQAERWAFHATRATGGIDIFYRRREYNVDRKTGNIADWLRGYGADWDAFITLDADSLMDAQTLADLADDLARDPSAALVQSVPRLMGGGSLFGRMMQFSNNTYGPWLAQGLARWCGAEGNYWGHNAIIRTRAFAACCGLPHLKGHGWLRSTLGGAIKSHDFVEAALLRRAGWGVRIRPDLAGTYEEAPQSLVDHVLRDRRWCQGNLQHIGMLALPGLAAVSRFHMLQGAMAYLASVVWFALLLIWAALGTEEATVFSYFSIENPLFPRWPEMDVVSKWTVLGTMAVLLLAPKLIAVAARPRPEGQRLVAYAGSVLCELALSIVLAPTMMVQHVLAVARTFAGLDTGWAPQNRGGTRLPPLALLRFHGVEVATGLVLCTGIVAGFVSWWLAPIAVCLLVAPVLSGLTALRLASR